MLLSQSYLFIVFDVSERNDSRQFRRKVRNHLQNIQGSQRYSRVSGEQQTEESGSDNNIKSEFVLLHTDTHGKHLFRKVMGSKSATVEMISPK